MLCTRATTPFSVLYQLYRPPHHLRGSASCLVIRCYGEALRPCSNRGRSHLAQPPNTLLCALYTLCRPRKAQQRCKWRRCRQQCREQSWGQVSITHNMRFDSPGLSKATQTQEAAAGILILQRRSQSREKQIGLSKSKIEPEAPASDASASTVSSLFPWRSPYIQAPVSAFQFWNQAILSPL